MSRMLSSESESKSLVNWPLHSSTSWHKYSQRASKSLDMPQLEGYFLRFLFYHKGCLYAHKDMIRFGTGMDLSTSSLFDNRIIDESPMHCWGHQAGQIRRPLHHCAFFCPFAALKYTDGLTDRIWTAAWKCSEHCCPERWHLPLSYLT